MVAGAAKRQGHRGATPAAILRGVGDPSLGTLLLGAGAVDPDHLTEALALQRTENARLGDILLARGWVSREALDAVLFIQSGLDPVDLDRTPPEPGLADTVDPALCLRLEFVPWRRAPGGELVLAVARAERLAAIGAHLGPGAGALRFVHAPGWQIERAIAGLFRSRMRARAERRTPEDLSCRGLAGRPLHRAAVLAVAGAGLLAVFMPKLLLAALFGLAATGLLLNMLLRIVGAFSKLAGWSRRWGPRRRVPDGPTAHIARRPVVSILVPIFREAGVLPRLLARIRALDYPPELLDVCFVTEEIDCGTRDALALAELPPWMRVITVPDAPLRTKPRALNYALDFCRGSLIGIYDAEDAPEPDQIRKVVERFHTRGQDLGCVQGVLDYYNARTNWIARCFTIEYAAWFRLVLPGLERLGLPVPLGGTTLFVRRDVLEALGGWDAHNVTEDADLGMRLARHGWRTEFIASVTREEAACHPWRWIRQRSRWLKGFAMTWASHMRAPRRLLSDLGWPGFLAFQALFLGTVAGFAVAPLLWSLWGWTLTGFNPLDGYLPGWAVWGLAGLFVLSEVTVIAVGLIATAGREHRHLWPWVPTLHFYFPLATLAVYKALMELVARPFFWDKTEHGRHQPEAGAAAG